MKLFRTLALAAALCACSLPALANSNFNYEEPRGGAAQFLGKMDHKDSLYYWHPDFYNRKSSENLLLLEKFKTRQQNTDYTCGPVVAMMVINYLNPVDLEKESVIAKKMGARPGKGTTTKNIVKYFDELGWQVNSSEDGMTPETYDKFLTFVDRKLRTRTPVMVERMDRAGHWRVIIGHDNMGTAATGDDVLILADTFDTFDHLQDGYIILPAKKFFHMWSNIHNSDRSLGNRQWVTATIPK